MAELLLEIGCEELPASFIDPAAQQLSDEISSRLRAAGIPHEAAEVQGTPRRLVVSFVGLPQVQPDQKVEKKGPAVSAAYDESGAPTKALEGFCRGQGIDPGEVVVDGDAVWVKKTVAGLPTAELLQTILPESVRALQFRKSMRWADTNLRFARPIRWILAVFEGRTVDFSIENVRSGNTSRGHRFLDPSEFSAATYAELESGLRSRKVLLRKLDRIERIQQGLAAAGPGVLVNEDLVLENAHLTEWPEAHLGHFRAEFLELSRPVLVTVMAKHERMFPVAAGDKLTNAFVAVRNGGDAETVSRGNAWVLNARFNDARFFYEEDKKHTLEDFLKKTERMTFQKKLGTVRQRADRLSALCRDVALAMGASETEAFLASQAGLLAKADLTTGLVSELDELQGVIGGEYAGREGLPEPVCWAIATQYDPSANPQPASEAARTAVRLLLADQIDKLSGFLGAGFVPTGSSDPFALRRAATLVVEAAWDWPGSFPDLTPLFDRALELYAAQGCELDANAVRAGLADLFNSRYEALLETRHDLTQAALLDADLRIDPRGVRFRAQALAIMAKDVPFVQTATRPANIVAAAQKKGLTVAVGEVTAPDLESGQAADLLAAVGAQAPLAGKCAAAEDAAGLVFALKGLEAPINAFFDSTMVMVDDTKVRDARLRLLANAAGLFRLAGEVGKIVIDG